MFSEGERKEETRARDRTKRHKGEGTMMVREKTKESRGGNDDPFHSFPGTRRADLWPVDRLSEWVRHAKHLSLSSGPFLFSFLVVPIALFSSMAFCHFVSLCQ